MTEYEAFALELAAEAARVTLPLFRNEAAAENKAGEGAFDPVTEADRGAEAAIRRMIAGIAQPYLDEVCRGGPSGARLVSRGAERAIRVRECARLTEAVIATTDPDIFTPPEFGAWTQVRAAARLARFGCDAYAYAMVAMGRIDLVAETGLKEWDWSALIPVVEAAGGQVTDWTGGPPSGDGRIIAVGDARVREDALVAFRRGVR